MTFSFDPEAEDEFHEAIAFYDERREDLGLDFSREVFATIDRILDFPQAWPVIDDDAKRSLVKRFPYGLVYFVEDYEVFIVAVMHLSREPDYWKYRVN